MKLLAVMLAAALALGIACAVCADSAPTDEDIKLAQLANATSARELYAAGEAASRKAISRPFHGRPTGYGPTRNSRSSGF
jgi:hypothetical protein